MAILKNNKILCGGTSGYSILSADSGSSWAFKQLPSYENINCIAQNDNALWLCGTLTKGGHISKTNETFGAFTQQNFSNEIINIQFANNNFGAACGGSALFVTNDSGTTWQITVAKNDLFSKVIITPNENIFACGLNGSIIFSKDKGNTYTTIKKGNGFTTNNRLTNMQYTPNNFVYAIGDAGLVYQINMNTSPFEINKLNINTTKDLKGICIKNNNTLAIVGQGGAYFEIGY
jgi:photosystem II stability/assembly factor-like uncharacterized protein